MDGNPTAEHTFSENNEGLWVIAAGGNKLVYGGVITGGNSPAGGGVYVAEGRVEISLDAAPEKAVVCM